MRAFNFDFLAQAIGPIQIGPIQVPPLEIPPPPVMLSAFMIVPSISSNIGGTSAAPKLVARAVLDQAEFIDNHMQGLTVAVVGASGAGKVRFQDNLITDCIGGIWFGGIAKDDVAEAQTFKSAASFFGVEEVGSALDVAMAYPLPGSAAESKTLPTNQFHLTNNRIDALPADGSISGSALLLAATINLDEILDATSILLNSNELRNRGPVLAGGNNRFLIPTAFLFSKAAAAFKAT